MLQLAVEFLLALTISLGLVPLCRSLSHRYGRVAQPREDRWHRRPVALFGGVAIGVTLFALAASFGLFAERPAVLIWALAVFITGLVDDFITLKPSTKLIVQFAAACALLFFGYRLNWLHSITLDSLVTLVWIVGVTNAFNLLDNMDGLCAGIALIVGATLFIDLAWRPGSVAMPEAEYLAILGGATLGFLVYNFHPASIFMGDSGSLLLGFSFAALTLTSAHQSAHRSNLLTIVAAPVFVLLIPIFDTTLVTVLRKLSGRAASSGGRDHSSHRLVAIGLSERAAVIVLWLLAAIGGAMALVVNVVSQSWAALVSVVFVIAMIIIAVYLARIRVYEGEDVRVLREGKVTPLVIDFMYKRRVAEVLLDFLLIAVAYSAAYRFRFENEDFLANFGSFRNSLPVVLSVQMIVFFAVGVYRGVWRFFGLNDAVVVAKGIVAGTILSQIIVFYSPRFIGYSRTVFAIYALLLMGLVTASRASFRLIGEFVQRQRPSGQRTAIYGAGDGGTFAVRELLSRRADVMRIIGFIDDDPHKIGTRVQGYRVLGDVGMLIEMVAAGQVDAIVVSSSSITPDRLSALASACARHDVAISRLRVGLEELSVPDVRPVEAAEAAQEAAGAGAVTARKLPFRKIKN
jgi:UDP-GlcNAc:undecaprenyl-phosphate GlcNAc-1-phosphate transferase